MDAKELMIGNYVYTYYDSNGFYTINHITPAWATVEMVRGKLHYDKILPILITDQWLMDFGAKVDCYSRCLHSASSMVEIEKNCKSGEFSYCQHQIRYVHQLQNLYFVLTGEELKIKP